MTLSPQDFSLQFHPALSTDTAEYICLVNDRHSPEAIIDLLVQGKWRNSSRNVGANFSPGKI